MTFGLCKDCRYWGVWLEDVCDFSGYNNNNMFELLAKADDDQGLEVDLKTSPDFGCVCFNPKEKKEDQLNMGDLLESMQRDGEGA